jgi:hypothetical protein
MYYYGTGSGIGLRLMEALLAAGHFDVPVLAVNNLNLLDSDGNPVGTNTDNEPSESGTSGSIGDPSSGAANSASTEGETTSDALGISTWTKTLIGMTVAAIFLGLIFCYLLYKRYWRVHDDDNADFESLASGRSIPRDKGEPEPDRIRTSYTKSASKRRQFEQTWNGDEDIGDEDYGANVQASKIRADSGGKTHVCVSSYCEVCSDYRSRIQFVPASGQDTYDELPPDATRSYQTSDTVNL